MSIVYTSTLNDYVPTTFSNIVDRFFNDSLTQKGGSQYSFVPKVDILENDKAFELHIAVPGMNKEDFKIDLNENHLTVSGERKFEKEKNARTYLSAETQFGSFSRTFKLNDDIKTDDISAKYNQGILEITLPKDEKKNVKATIKVN